MIGLRERFAKASPEGQREPGDGDRPTPMQMAAPGVAHGASHLVHLQRTAGNQAVMALLARAQAKLVVGPAGDHYEREADAIAAKVVRSLRDSERVADGAAVCGVEQVQRRATVGAVGAEAADLDTATERAVQGARSGGTSMDQPVQRQMERAFGAEFADVRLHSGPHAAALNRQLGARAFTLGSDIFFRDRNPDTSTVAGQELLAHELAHTLQQGGRGVRHTQRGVETIDDRQVHADVEPRHPWERGTATERALLHRPRRAGNAPLSAALGTTSTPPHVQRTVWVNDGTQKGDLQQALRQHLKGAKAEREWYQKMVSPKLFGQFGYAKFAGYLFNRTGAYDIEVTAPKPLAQLSFDELTTAVISAINTRLLSQRIERGHSQIGRVKLITRNGFPSAVKNAFDKVPVIREIKSEGGGPFAPKQIHLRHFVMGSWFRALPDVVRKAKLNGAEGADLAKRVSELVPRVGPFAGRPGVAATGDPRQDLDNLATLLHDLLPNLNAGEGPENTLIGFLSNGLSNLAEDVRKDQMAFPRDEIDDLIITAVDAISLVATEHRELYKDQFDPVGVFAAMVQHLVGDKDPVEPEAMSTVLHEFAFQLGMDLMKRQAGMAQQHASAIAVCQAKLLPVGQYLYSLIVKAQTAEPDPTDLGKLFNAIDDAITTFETQAANAKK